MFVSLLPVLIIPINDGASVGLGFSYLDEESFWSAGYMGDLLVGYPLTRLYDFEHPGLFSAVNLYRAVNPLSVSLAGKKGPWAGAAEGLFAMQGDTLTSDRVLVGAAGLRRDMGSWACGLGFSYSDFSYKQRTLGVWRNWALDTRTVLPSLELVLPFGDVSVSTRLSAGYAESVGGDVLLPMGLGVSFGSNESSVQFSYLTLSNTAAARGLMGIGARGNWGVCDGMSLAAAGRAGIGVGGGEKRLGADILSEITGKAGSLSISERLWVASYMDDSLKNLAVQDGIALEWAVGPLAIIGRPQATYYSSGEWKFGALGGASISAGALKTEVLAGRLDLERGLALEANMEVKLW